MKLNHILKGSTDYKDYIFSVGSKVINYQQAYLKINWLTEYLSSRNIKKVALYFNNAADFSIALLACVNGNVDVYLPPLLNKSSNQYLEVNKVELLLTDEIFDFLDISILPSHNWEAQSGLGSKDTQLNLTHNINIYFQTSGSSGHAKVVQKNWSQILEEAVVLEELIKDKVIPFQTVVLSSVSPQHLYGFSFRIILSLYLGLPIFDETIQFPEALLENSLKFPSVLWVSSPTLLHTISSGYDILNLKENIELIISAGSQLQLQCRRNLELSLKSPILEIYGSTETGAIAFKTDNQYWCFLMGIEYNKNNNGMVFLKSPWCTGEYLADELLIKDEGFELLGRVDRILKLADKRISLEAIEQELINHPFICDAYVNRHPVDHHHLVALLAFTDQGIESWRQYGRKKIILELKKIISQKYDKIAIPRYWRFSDVLPRNEQGKLIKADFEAIALNSITELVILNTQWIDENQYQVEAKVPIDLSYFNGHFDQFHLVPGVIQLKWVITVLKEINWLSGDYPKIENLKFKDFLRPNDRLMILLKRDILRNKIIFEILCGEQKISSGKLCLSE